MVGGGGWLITPESTALSIFGQISLHQWVSVNSPYSVQGKKSRSEAGILTPLEVVRKNSEI
ncbi:hypothetical protein QTJ16_001131 [Diplocarpon rosae]|uniref:Uncharacterized protein n=1 Tax=Diplocarpon rosae TaxID=946125 RepID=A0AAD9T6X5_9HELO|nr:hypothetical protein QTJ16_001131 [Diplocarpon rosae]